MRYHFPLTGMAIIFFLKRKKITSIGKAMEKLEPLYSASGKQPLWKEVWWFLKKLNIELPYDPAISS